jgi:response regulator RpfG family c-di-GMP phosphodiesterase
VFELIRCESGTHFDPQAVEVFFQVMDRIKTENSPRTDFSTEDE